MPILGILASSFPADSGAFESIATTTVGAGGAASITFSNIPATYKHLQIRGITRDNAASIYVGDTYLTFNGSGANYMAHSIFGEGQGITAIAQGFSTVIKIGQTASSSALANNFSNYIVDILDYASTSKNKVTRTLNGYENNNNGTGQEKGFIFFSSGLWMDTSAITSVSLRTNATLQQYSEFALYGIKG